MRESKRIGVSFGNSFVQSYSVSSPVDVEKQQSESNRVLIGNLIIPRLILLRPSNVAVIDELRLVSLLELPLEDLLLGLQGVIFMVSPPIVKVVIPKTDCFKK
jgi:hypothetical protein